MAMRYTRLLFYTVLLTIMIAAPVFARDGKLRIHVNPTQAFIYLNGRAMGDASLSGRHDLLIINLGPGEHTVGIYNYGYKSQTHKVTVVEGETTHLDVVLEPIPGSVSGPWGRIQIEGGDHAAVLMNGKTPDFLVGEADDFNHDAHWKQQLLVPPGTHQMTLVRGSSEIWSGPVTVAANQRVIVNVKEAGEQKVTDWPRGQTLGSLPPFRARIASATVAVWPVAIQQFGANPAQINCGESSRLNWSTSGTVRSEISGQGEVAASGEQVVQPKQTTTYNLTASGPGGTATSSATVNVNTAVQASLEVSPAEISYQRVGDKVVEQGSSTIKWSTSNADSVTLEPFGKVDPSGSRTVQAAPQQTAPGPISEAVNYTLSASNTCGGSETRTAALHIAGSIKPGAEVIEASFETRLASIYFPTDYPLEDATGVGLVASQRQILSQFAESLKKYLEVDPNVRFRVEGNADKRASEKYNLALSERRVEIVRQFLLGLGIPSAAIETKAFGLSNNLDSDAVRQLEERNPNQPTMKMVGQRAKDDWLAHNRRVDVVLLPSGLVSARFYPYNAGDFKIIWQAAKPGRRAIERAQ
jgi:outer membrane protein OmpA-like peptidoglycan-associated protein